MESLHSAQLASFDAQTDLESRSEESQYSLVSGFLCQISKNLGPLRIYYYARGMKILLSIIMVLSSAVPTWAAEEDPFQNLDYPELQVAPRASERMIQMAQLEQDQMWLNQWTIMTSGFMTLATGFKNLGQYKQTNPTDGEKKDSDMASNTAIGVGAGWLVLGGYLMSKKPISNRMGELRKLSAKDRRTELSRERYAEEILETVSETQQTLNTLSVITNFAGSLYVTSYAATDENKVLGILAVTASVLPWVFPTMYTTGYKKHLEYKRKIYAPLVWMDFKPVNSELAPQVNLNWSF